MSKPLPTHDDLDLLADVDPLKLRDKAFALLAKVERLTAERDRHRAELAAIRGIHSEFRIYEVGADDHDDDADLVELDDGRYARRSGYQYSICRGCCASGDAQSELCADDHDHSECWPCPTYLAATPSTTTETTDV